MLQTTWKKSAQQKGSYLFFILLFHLFYLSHKSKLTMKDCVTIPECEREEASDNLS